MPSTGVWFETDRWPAGRSAGQFAQSVFRIEGCRTDREKALAFYTWFMRCMNRGPNLELPGPGGRGRCFDTGILFTSWGHNECTGWGWIAADALNAAGLKTRRVAAHDMGHTFYEVWYEGIDGMEAWHAFDPFIGWYYLNEAGEVASCAELAANPRLVTDPIGGPDRLGHHTERSHMLHRYKLADQLDIDQPHRNEPLSYSVHPGQQWANLWRPEKPHLALIGTLPSSERSHSASGAHCDIEQYSNDGTLVHPEHEPHWKRYRWPTDPANTTFNGGAPVRWHGCGALRWQPVPHGNAAADSSHFARFDADGVRPTAAHKFTEVWYRIRLPYLASHMYIEAVAEGGGGDYLGIGVSTDERRSIWSLYAGPPTPMSIRILNGQKEVLAGGNSIQGLREFLLRIDMHTHSAQPTLNLRALKITVGYQVNMHLLPRLLPGKNVARIEAAELDGAKLSAEWSCTLPDGDRLDCVALDAAGEAQADVELNVEHPEDVIMRGVRLHVSS